MGSVLEKTKKTRLIILLSLIVIVIVVFILSLVNKTSQVKVTNPLEDNTINTKTQIPDENELLSTPTEIETPTNPKTTTEASQSAIKTPTPEPALNEVEGSGAILDVNPAFLNFGPEVTNLSINIINIGKDPLVWNIAPECPEGIYIDPAGGIVEEDPNILNVYVDRSLFKSGITECYLYIYSDEGNKAISVTVEVEESAVPTDSIEVEDL